MPSGRSPVGICESILVIHREGRFLIGRAGANRFELIRSAGGWEILHRTTRVLDGTPESRELLRMTR